MQIIKFIYFFAGARALAGKREKNVEGRGRDVNSWNMLPNFHKDLVTHNVASNALARVLNDRYKIAG